MGKRKQEQPSSSEPPSKKRKPIGIRAAYEKKKKRMSKAIRNMPTSHLGGPVKDISSVSAAPFTGSLTLPGKPLRNISGMEAALTGFPSARKLKQMRHAETRKRGEHNMAAPGKKHLPNYPEQLRRVIPKVLPGDKTYRSTLEIPYSIHSDPEYQNSYKTHRRELNQMPLAMKPESELKEIKDAVRNRLAVIVTEGPKKRQAAKLTYTRNFPRTYPLSRQELLE